jgi:hypothetical protein
MPLFIFSLWRQPKVHIFCGCRAMRELEEQVSKGGQGTTPSAQGSGVTDDVEREEDFCGSPSPPTWGGGGDLTTKGKNSPSLCIVNC